MTRLMMATALVALVGASALAQSPGPRPAPGSKTQSSDQPGHAGRGYGSGHDAPYRAFGAGSSKGLDGATREKALRDCAEMSQKYSEGGWGAMQMHQWRTCMMEHGQPE